MGRTAGAAPDYNLNTLSRVVGVTNMTIMREIRRGRLKATREKESPGVAWRITPADAQEWLDTYWNRHVELISRPQAGPSAPGTGLDT
jgi:hypothetical protein